MTIKIDFDLFIDIVEFPSHLILTDDGAGNNEDYYATGGNNTTNDDDDFSLLYDEDDTSYCSSSIDDDLFDFRYDEPVNQHIARLQAEIEQRISELTNNNDVVRTPVVSLGSADTQDNSDADSLVLANTRGVPRRPVLGFRDSLVINRSRTGMEDLPPLINFDADILDDIDSECDDDDDFSVSESDFEEIDDVAIPAATPSEEDDLFTTYIVSLDDMKIIGVDEDNKGCASDEHRQATSSSSPSASRCPPRRGILRRTSSSMGSNARRRSVANTRA